MLLAAEISADLKRLFSGLRTKTPFTKNILNPWDCWCGSKNFRMRSTYVQGILYPILSDIFCGLFFSLLLNWNWKFFDRRRIFHSSDVPIRLLTTKKSFSHILENITESPQITFERFLMTTSSARSVLVIFLLKKNLTSNRSKPIWVLTLIWSLYSDDR